MIGLVVLSSEASFVGTITSGGTDVIEMPASTSPGTTGAALVVDVVVAAVVGGSVLADVATVGMVVVATVVRAAVDATGAAVGAGGLDDVGAASGVVAPAVHAAVSNATATTYGFDLTRLPPLAPYCRILPDD